MNRRVSRPSWRSAAALLTGVLSASLLSAAPAAAVHGAVPGDFNGDGYRDAVLPAPGADVAGHEAAGAIVVLYGSKSGLSATHRRTLTQNSPGVPSYAETGDRFGAATATADLNRDGYADLVVSAPGEDTTEGKDYGFVSVLWGSKSGLNSATQLPTADIYPGQSAPSYGTDLAAVSLGAGRKTAVLVAGYAAASFTGPFSRTGTFGGRGRSDDMEVHTFQSVALGDFDGDGLPDQAAVSTRVYGESGGYVYAPVSGLGELAEGNGLIAAAGDVNGDGYDDLVVGDPAEPDVRGVDGELGGRVLVYRGHAGGIGALDKPVELTQNTAGVPGMSERYDTFGAALTVADLNRDGADDIVVGTPHEGYSGTSRPGEVTVIPGRKSGALGTGSYSFNQAKKDIPGSNERGDRFGTSVAAGDINGDGKPELFISAAGENNSTGAVWVLPGGTSGPTAKGSRLFTAAAVRLTQTSGTLLGGNGLLDVI